MTKRKTTYKRCKKCKQLVRDPDNCAYCANRNPLRISRESIGHGAKETPTLDTQEGNEP